MKKPLLYGLLFVVLSTAILLTNPILPGRYTPLRLVAIIAETAVLIKLMQIIISAAQKRRGKVADLALTVGSVLLVFIVAEGIFMVVPQSHSIGYTLASQVWFNRYWKPLNSLGFRDDEPPSLTDGKKVVVVLGDSFAAGHGIKDHKKRFSNLLQEKLHDKYVILNMGILGADTREEYEALLRSPVKPDILILSYYGNDIDVVAMETGLEFEGFTPYQSMDCVSRFIVTHSYLLNYLYWQFPHADRKGYVDFWRSAHGNQTVMDRHKADLRKFIEITTSNKIRLIVVVFPYLADIESSAHFLGPIKAVFLERKIDVLDVSDLVRGLQPCQLMINKNDSHPSELVNRKIAEALYELLISKNL